MNRHTLPLIEDPKLKAQILFEQCRRSIRAKDLDHARSVSNIIPDSLLQRTAAGKVASNFARDPEQADKAAMAILSYSGSSGEKDYDLTWISLAYAIQGHFDAAETVAKHTPRDTAQLGPKLVEFYKQYHHLNDTYYESSAITFNIANLAMALLHSTRRNVVEIAARLRKIPVNSRHGLAGHIGLFARILAQSGYYEEALALLKEIPVESDRRLETAGMLNQIAFPQNLADAALIDLIETGPKGQGPLLPEVEALINERIFSNQTQSIVQMLRQVNNVDYKNNIVKTLVDNLYTITKTQASSNN